MMDCIHIINVLALSATALTYHALSLNLGQLVHPRASLGSGVQELAVHQGDKRVKGNINILAP